MSQIVNLTPHPVTVVVGAERIEFARCPNPPRLEETVVPAGSVLTAGIAIPVVRKAVGSCVLPAEQPGTYYIVPAMITAAFRERNDLLVPHDVIRDEAGKIIGCRGFARV